MAYGGLPDIGYSALAADTPRDGFTCGVSEIDTWFRNKSLNDHNKHKHVVTCASFDEKPEEIIGFFVFSTVVEDAKKLTKQVPFFAFATDRFCPCLQLVYMAMRTDLQRKEHGGIVLGEIITTFAHVGSEIGLPALILTPINDDAERFYRRKGFVSYEKRYGKGMYLPLQTAIATVEAAARLVEQETA
jgi:hypothetical protein